MSWNAPGVFDTSVNVTDVLPPGRERARLRHRTLPPVSVTLVSRVSPPTTALLAKLIGPDNFPPMRPASVTIAGSAPGMAVAGTTVAMATIVMFDSTLL